jgi:hypothetical protein
MESKSSDSLDQNTEKDSISNPYLRMRHRLFREFESHARQLMPKLVNDCVSSDPSVQNTFNGFSDERILQQFRKLVMLYEQEISMARQARNRRFTRQALIFVKRLDRQIGQLIFSFILVSLGLFMAALAGIAVAQKGLPADLNENAALQQDLALCRARLECQNRELTQLRLNQRPTNPVTASALPERRSIQSPRTP